MTKRKVPEETGKDPAERVEEDEIVLRNAQGSQQGGGMSNQTEGSGHSRSTGRKGK